MRLKIEVIFGLLMASLISVSRAICPDLCTCDDVNLIVTCIKAGLDVMPNTLNPGLETIVYKYNDFATIYSSLTFLPNLIKVDLSHNKIVTISDRAFQYQNRLTQLKLESNKISQVTNKTFEGLVNLQVLILRGNLIEKLPRNLFMHSNQLQELDLARNRISAIDEKAFDGLSSLQILNLADNALTTLPSEALKKVPDLAELYLSGNPIKVLPDRAFAHFQRLTVLDLDSSRLRVIARTAFRGLGTLRTLKLADNNLSSVPSESFQDVPNLEALDLGRNPFQVITANAFRFLTKLKHFELSGCGRLTSIEAGAFAHCVDLEKISVTLNRRLTSIARGAFDAMPNLRFFDLSDNALQRVPRSLVNWKDLRSLSLAGNPWSCDCDLAFMSEVVKDLLLKEEEAEVVNNQEASEAVMPNLVSEGVCVFPQSLKHKKLSEMPPEADLQCDSVEINEVHSHPHESASSAVASDSVNNRSKTYSTVIIGAAVAALLVVLLAVILLVYRFRYPIQDWVKAVRWHQHDQAIARKGVIHSHHQDPYLRQHEYRQPSYSCDDEHYYYVATMQNRMAAGKHIPVTEL